MRMWMVLLCLGLLQVSVQGIEFPQHEACYMQSLYSAFVPQNRNIQFAVLTLDGAGRDENYNPSPNNPHGGNLPNNPVNYLVRTRTNTEHAERLLVNEAEGMIDRYRQRHRRLPRTIHLLSYLEPCADCGSTLVNFLRNYVSQGVSVFLGYMDEYRRMSNRDRIQNMMAYGEANIPYDQIREPSEHDELRRKKRSASSWCQYPRPGFLRALVCGSCLA
ncbi:hypothetical protein SNE40_018903 [Patella caerulea]|uniref:CMP/dCMP-type deaminase domain-containing protein n=1 Tax=Patella caerulea TaxID=87958 RepID=A0AAN8J6W2_PATCE